MSTQSEAQENEQESQNERRAGILGSAAVVLGIMNWLRLILFVVAVFSLTVSSLTASSAHAQALRSAQLERFSIDLAQRHPMTACLAQEVMGEADYAEFVEFDSRGGWISCGRESFSSADGYAEFAPLEDASGGTTHLHCHHSYDIPEGRYGDHTFVWVDENADMFIASRQGNAMELHTNVRTAQQTWPSEVQGWLRWNASDQFDEPGVLQVHVNSVAFEAACGASRREYQRYLAVHDGESCNVRDLEHHWFRNQGQVVIRESRLRPRLIRSGGRRLRTGDLVQLSQTRTFTATHRRGFVCAYFRAVSGAESMGWVDANDLGAITSSMHVLATLPALPWPRYALAVNGPGVFSDGPTSQFAFLGQDAGEVRFDVDEMYNRYVVPERPMQYTSVSPRWARHPHGGGHIVRLNNAIYIEFLEPIVGGVEGGIFYPARGPLTLASPL